MSQEYRNSLRRFCVVHETAKDEDIDFALGIIQEHTREVLAEHQEEEKAEFMAKGPKSPTPLDKKLVRKFSFTRSVSRAAYKRSVSKSNLHDGATPIMVVEDNVHPVETIDEDVFCNSR